MRLTTEPNLAQPDDAYALLLEHHEGKTPEESHAFNARLILILMNQVGDMDVLRAAFQAAEA
ncbi:DUF2783 domain-containing protein [Roseivivax sp. CAU 1753]